MIYSGSFQLLDNYNYSIAVFILYQTTFRKYGQEQSTRGFGLIENTPAHH